MTQVKSTYRDILNMAYPVMIGSLATTILNITDTIFLGRIGEVELGASAMGGVLYFVFVMIGMAIGIGTQILIARRAGEKDESAIGEIFDNSLIILVSLSIFLFIFMEFFSPFLLNLLLKSDQDITASLEFIHYRAFGIFFVMIATAFRAFYIGIARPKVFGFYSFLMAGINILLCYTLVFGNFGFPRMGIAGAGLASSISELVSLIFLMLYTYFKPDIKKFRMFRFRGLQRQMISRIVNLSAPLVVQNLLSMGSWFIFFVFIEKMGEHALASSNIVRGAYMVSLMPIWGFSVAANSMISNFIGQQKGEEVILLLNRIIKLAVFTSLLIILVNFFFEKQILGIFTADSVLIRDSSGSFRIVNMAMIFFAFAIVSISAVSGTGATRMALYIEIVAILIYLIYNYSITFILHGSVEMVWFSELIYWLFTGIASYLYIRSRAWMKISL